MSNGHELPPAPPAARFARIPIAAVNDKRVSNRAFRVLAAVASYADKEGRCWPSQVTIGRGMGVSRQAVGAHIRALKRCGHLSIERRTRRRGGWASNSYLVHGIAPPKPKQG